MTTNKYCGYIYSKKLPTPHQLAAARVVCGLGLRELAKLADTSTVTIQRYEKHRQPISHYILKKLQFVLEQRGIVFTFGERAGITFEPDTVADQRHPYTDHFGANTL